MNNYAVAVLSGVEYIIQIDRSSKDIVLTVDGGDRVCLSDDDARVLISLLKGARKEAKQGEES